MVIEYVEDNMRWTVTETGEMEPAQQRSWTRTNARAVNNDFEIVDRCYLSV